MASCWSASEASEASDCSGCSDGFCSCQPSHDFLSLQDHYKPTFWDQTHELWPAYVVAFTLLVPRQGDAPTPSGELLRVMSRLYHDYYNNGNVTLFHMFGNQFNAEPRSCTVPWDAPAAFKEFMCLGPQEAVRQSVLEAAMEAVVWHAWELVAGDRGYNRAAARIQAAFKGHGARKEYAAMIEAHFAPGGRGARQTIDRLQQNTPLAV